MDIVLAIANYYIEHKSTVRDCALIFGKSKSTIHNYLHISLPKISPSLYEKVSAQAQLNFNEKHIRGGNSTKLKYLTNHRSTSDEQITTNLQNQV